jgi:hypothetical protein
MIQYPKPVRKTTSEPFIYTFKDENGVVIDLSNAQSLYLELKVQGQLFQTVPASFMGSPPLGTLTAGPTTLPVSGIWTAQFFAVDSLGNRCIGEPIRFRVVDNVEDLALDGLLNY